MINDKVGYIDEYGDKSINYQKSGVTTYFIVASVVVDRSSVEQIELEISEIRNEFIQGAELKSKNFKPRQLGKRLDILKRISTLDFTIYAVLVDKRLVFENSGLKFRDTFFKYVNKLLDNELYRHYPNLELVADEHGSEKFMDGFIEYVKRNHFQTSFFRNPKFRFGNSKQENLIQLADFVAGSLARSFDPDKMIDNPSQVIDILKPRILQLREWPSVPQTFFKNSTLSEQEYDKELAEFSLQLIQNYIEKNQTNPDEKVINQLVCLSYLVFRFKMNPSEYVFTDELLRVIRERGTEIRSKQIFRGDIIANLRDAGILLVSSQSGYKIPCRKSDLIEFFNRYNNLLIPMLKRLDRTNYLYKVASNNRHDLLGEREYDSLNKMIEIMKNTGR